MYRHPRVLPAAALLVVAACSSSSAPDASDDTRGEGAGPGAAASPSPADPGAMKPSAASPSSPPAMGPAHLRYLAINIGNVSLDCHAYEYKLCSADTTDRIRDYIGVWQPDVVLLSEVLDEPQLDRVLHDSDLRAGGSTTSNLGGPILPPELGYAHVCHPNVNRVDGVTNNEHPLDDSAASHRHECVAWRTDRLALVSEAHVFGPNSDALKSKCNYDFTAQAATLKLLGSNDGTGKPIELTGIAPHPASDSEDVACRKDTVLRMWNQLATAPRVFLGGDFNTGEPSELQVPSRFMVNYTHGLHFATQHTGEYTAAYYIRGTFSFDHAFASFGHACTTCGSFYGGAAQDLPFGSALGDWDGHPWAAKPGLDHRQLLVDLEF